MEYDCTGLVLAPGFVDVHTHSDRQLFQDPSRLCKLRQGVTMEIGGNCGNSQGPYHQPVNPVYDSNLGISKGHTVFCETYAALCESQADKKPGCHQMSFVGHLPLRGSVVGMEQRDACGYFPASQQGLHPRGL